MHVAITGASGEQLMLLANGVIVSTNGQVLNSVINPSSDFMKLSDGTYVLAQGSNGSTEEARLTAISARVSTRKKPVPRNTSVPTR